MLSDCVVPTIKQGRPFVLVWVHFYYDGAGDLRKIEATIRKETYLEILQKIAVIRYNFNNMQ